MFGLWLSTLYCGTFTHSAIALTVAYCPSLPYQLRYRAIAEVIQFSELRLHTQNPTCCPTGVS
ncbi:MAG: hypothetical protein HC886_08620 [Leptolyngbyaceae cyanobacterium SM1_1_3]|nr:hypothetical protein [Leptolyngbyaceae cyanobacterium SM1_1_3]NJN01738.1 hypothetical protein [Leptolyngbyaceae cyanobacterium RM1_1_2]